MKKSEKYETPEIEVTDFASRDVLTTSTGYNGIDTEEDLLNDLYG